MIFILPFTIIYFFFSKCVPQRGFFAFKHQEVSSYHPYFSACLEVALFLALAISGQRRERHCCPLIIIIFPDDPFEHCNVILLNCKHFSRMSTINGLTCLLGPQINQITLSYLYHIVGRMCCPKHLLKPGSRNTSYTDECQFKCKPRFIHWHYALVTDLHE